jgi:shikimate 5-dehydrogenase
VNILSLCRQPKPEENLQEPIDFLEWRLDLAPFDKSLARKLKIPWIATLRCRKEGGLFEGSLEEKYSLLQQALDCGATYADLEARFPAGDLPLEKLIRSLHLQKNENLREKTDILIKAPGKILKWLRYTEFLEDFLPEEKKLLQQERPVILIHDGPGGQWTRLKPPGLNWSYLSENAVNKTSPWQFSSDEMPEKSTRLYALLGFPVAQSLSAKFHNKNFNREQKKRFYLKIPLKNLDNFFGKIDHHFDGLSITTPFKENILPYASSLSKTCRKIQAANTFLREGICWQAHNTDATALQELIRNLSLPASSQVTVFGCGGFSRAAIWACQQEKLEVLLVNRTIEKGRGWAKKLNCGFQALKDWRFQEEKLLIQGTSAYLHGEALPFETKNLPKDTALLEATIQDTPFLKKAPKSCRKIRGVELFECQAKYQALLWSQKNGEN